jgi:hypothetical protein
MVFGTEDSGFGTLRAAITAADADTNVPHTIYLLSTGTIALASALPTITRDMTIQMGVSGTVTVTGSASGNRVFTQATPNLTISGLTLTGRATGSGAAVAQTAANENLTITNSAITGSSAGGRGAVYNLAGGTVTLSGCTVSNNTAAGGVLWVNQASAGGAALDIVNSQVINNVSTGPGGAVGSYFGGTLTIDHSTVAGNSAGGGGGAAYLWGTPAGTTIISNSTVANNTAGGTGGAILLNAGSNAVTVASSTLMGNVGLAAGAIDNTGTGSITLDNAILSGNTAGGVPEVSAATTVAAAYSAIDTLAGFTLTNNGGNLSAANSTPAALALQPLANAAGPNGSFAVIGLGVGGTAIDAGDPGQGGAGHTDELGFHRPQGAGVDIGAVEKVVPPPPQVPQVGSVVVGSGAQRSEVTKIVVTFNGPVSFTGGNANAAAAFQLQHLGNYTTTYTNAFVHNLQAAVTTNGSGQTVVTLTFTATGNAAQEIDPVSTQNGGQPSLNDGRYQLTIFAANVSGPGGQLLAGDGAAAGIDYVSSSASGPNGYGDIYRLFGDASGEGVLSNLPDLAYFRSAYNAGTGNPAYLAYLDADNNGAVDLTDLAEWRNRYGKHV